MRIAGQRADGALYLSLGGGVAVVLKGNRVTPPLDEIVVDTMGPWVSASNTYEERVRVERLLNIANLANVEYFLLKAAFEYGQRAEPDPDAGGAEPVSQSTGPDPNAVSKSPDPDAVGLSPNPDAVSKSTVPVAPATPAKKNPFAKKKIKRRPSPFGAKSGAVALDQYHSLDDEPDHEKEPVSEIAKVAQTGETTAPEPTEEVMNLPPAPVVGPGDPIVVVSPEDRKKRREQLKEKIKKAARSKGRIGDVLGDDEVDDEDLFAMAKELGVTHR